MHPHHEIAAPGVGDMRDIHPDPAQILGCGIAVGVRGEHHRPLPGPDTVEVDQPAHRGGQHHPGHVVAREDVGPLDQPRRHDQCARPCLDQPLRTLIALRVRPATALHHRDPVLVVAAQRRRVREHLDTGLSGDRGPQLRQHRELVRTAPPQVPTELVLLLHEQHPRPRACRRHRGGDPGRATPCHQDVGVDIALVAVDVRGVPRDLTSVRETREHLLVGGPQPLRLDEGLVVEAGREEPPQDLVDRLDVVAQRRPGVLRRDPHPLGDQPMPGPYVRLVADLQDRARVVVTRREQAPRAVVLEASREHPLPRRRQRRHDRVTGMGRDAAAVPPEVQGGTAVDDLTGLGSEPVAGPGRRGGPCVSCGHRASLRVSLLTVSRSSRKYRRQPAPWYQLSRTQPRGLRRR